MSNRRVVTKSLQGANGEPVDSYLDRLVKYIPSEIVGAWVAINGIWKTVDGSKYEFHKVGLWTCFGICVVLTALYIWRLTSKPKQDVALLQITTSTVSFAIWVFALQNYFPLKLGFDNPPLWSVVLVLYTAAVAMLPPAIAKKS
jgi:hypothetical protein